MSREVSPQESFWTGEFGVEYVQRNVDRQILAGNISLFSSALSRTTRIRRCIEFGANIGLNLIALKNLYPQIERHGVEINSTAAQKLADEIGGENVTSSSIFDFEPEELFDLVLIKGVLIHLSPDLLPLAYEKLYKSSSKYILICEYYNPTPVTIDYRGHSDRLFKRDFAGEILDLYEDLILTDYGFVYHRDRSFPLDDISWFLLEKTSR